MRFAEIYEKPSPVISFELFPPKTEKGVEVLGKRLPKLIDLEPDFISVTHGAMGSTRGRTLEITSKIKNGYGQEVAHHLTCVGSTRDDISRQLEAIQKYGIENIVALRGDPPQGEASFQVVEGGYSHANQLVERISEMGGFGIAVSGYPEKHIEAPDLDSDLGNLKRKVNSGADVIITQLFYENEDFYRFVERCRRLGIQEPIVPGLMPILNATQIKRITEMCGATIPDHLLKAMAEAGDDKEAVHQIGIEHTSEQALDLLEHGVAGIHFYVLNQHFHIAEIMERIKPSLMRSEAGQIVD